MLLDDCVSDRFRGYNNCEVPYFVDISIGDFILMLSSLGLDRGADYFEGVLSSRRFDIYLRSCVRFCRSLGYSLHDLSVITGLGLGKLNYVSDYDGLWSGDGFRYILRYSDSLMSSIDIIGRRLVIRDTIYKLLNRVMFDYYLLCDVLSLSYRDHYSSLSRLSILRVMEPESLIDRELKLLLGLYRLYSFDREDISNILFLPYDFVCKFYRSNFYCYEGLLRDEVLVLEKKLLDYCNNN